MDLLGTDWIYISEGNVHIVLQLSDTEHVLRLIKEDGKSTSYKDVQNSTNFVNFVMAPLLNCKSTQEIVHLSEKSVSKLSKMLYNLRPENRKFKSKLSTFAIKTLNLAMVTPFWETNYCVEIKPKEGFLASSLKALSQCYYCLNQYLKLDMNRIEKRSDYCPLDLFSGERKRMKKALINLINNPQNNFKIFKQGEILYSENSEDHIIYNVVQDMGAFENLNVFLDFLIEILLSTDNQRVAHLVRTPEIPTTPKSNSNCLESTLLHNFNEKHQPFLSKLLQIQMVSDSSNIDLSNIGHGKEYVQDIIGHIQNGLDLNLDADRKQFLSTANSLHLAMISAVAKDCSIMISFTPDCTNSDSYINLDGRLISYRVSVTDLEPKNVKSLLRRKETESKMIDAYRKYSNNVDMVQDF